MSDEVTQLLERGAVAHVTRRPSPSRLRVWMAILLLIFYGGVVLAVTMSPTPLDRGFSQAIAKVLDVLHRNGVPEWFAYSQLEFAANIAMFIPLGFLVGLVLPRRVQWLGIILIPAFSGLIEFTQSAFLDQRFATVSDVIANSAGGWFGLLIAAMMRAAVYARDEKVIAIALWEARQPRTAGARR